MCLDRERLRNGEIERGMAYREIFREREMEREGLLKDIYLERERGIVDRKMERWGKTDEEGNRQYRGG